MHSLAAPSAETVGVADVIEIDFGHAAALTLPDD